MSPNTIKLVLIGFVWIFIISCSLLVIGVLVTDYGPVDQDLGLWVTLVPVFWVFFGSMIIGSIILSIIFLFFAPVRCNREGCCGRMHRVWIRVEKGYRLGYKCDRCGSTYDTGLKVWDETYMGP